MRTADAAPSADVLHVSLAADAHHFQALPGAILSAAAHASLRVVFHVLVPAEQTAAASMFSYFTMHQLGIIYFTAPAFTLFATDTSSSISWCSIFSASSRAAFSFLSASSLASCFFLSASSFARLRRPTLRHWVKGIVLDCLTGIISAQLRRGHLDLLAELLILGL